MAPIFLAFAIFLGFLWLLVAFPSFRVAVVIFLALGFGAYYLNYLLASRREAEENKQIESKKQQKVVESYVDVPAGRPMEFAQHQSGAMRIDGNTSWISADGVITADTPSAFEKFLQDALIFKKQAIVINSQGGSVLAAMTLGKIIRKNQFLTAVARTVPSGESIMQGHISISSLVPGECVSACVFALAGGVERSVADGSRVGVDQISMNFVGPALSYFTEMGADAASIVTIMVSQTPTQTMWLSGPQQASTKVIYDPNVFDDWTIKPYKAGLAAFTKTGDGARWLTLFCSAGRMKFKLAANGGAYSTDFVSSVGDVNQIEVAGRKIAKPNFKISDVKGGMEITGDWTGADAKDGDRATFSLFGETTGTVADLFSMYKFNERGFQQSLSLARKNCVS